MKTLHSPLRLVMLGLLGSIWLALSGCDAGPEARLARLATIATPTPAASVVTTDEDRDRRAAGVLSATVEIADALVADPRHSARPDLYTLHEGPVRVRAGVPFAVTVASSGGGSMRAEPSEVEVQDRTATVTVYDSVARPREGYEERADLRFIPRTDWVTLSSVGAGEIVIRGAVGDPLGPAGVQPFELRFLVIVIE